MLSAGILTIAFGKEYERLSFYTMSHTRKFTDLPICVITNIPEKDRAKRWSEVSNVIFIDSPKVQAENRAIKLVMNKLTPFEHTLYMDCDSLVQNEGVEYFLLTLAEREIAFNPLLKFEKGAKILKIYKDCMDMFGLESPLNVYNGGFIAFRNTRRVSDFFELWTEMWLKFAHGREMPPLNCAIKKSGIPHGKFIPGFIAAEHEDKNAVIQHNFNNKKTSFCKKFNIPKWVEYKPFDGDRKDFSWV